MHTNNNSKRQYRELSDATKQKISFRLKGRSKSDTHKEAISNGMKEYWKTIPNKPTSTNSPTTSTNPTSQSDKTLQNGVITKNNFKI